jgi:hypothetical protein
MANPNIVAVTSIKGFTTQLALTTSAQSLLSNASGSGIIYKVNTIIITNIDGSAACDVTCRLYSAAALGGTPMDNFASTLSIPADGRVDLIDKNSSFYLLEDKSIGILASANSDLVALISGEEII